MQFQIKRHNKKRRIALTLAVATSVGVLASWLATPVAQNVGRIGHTPGWAWLQSGTANAPTPQATAPAPTTADALRSPDVLRSILFQGSFAGTQPVGNWCVSSTSALTPCLGLRERFEYYINGIGEISIAEVRALIEDEARRALGAQLAGQVMAIYDKYWAVRNHEYQTRLEMADISTWMPALREAQQVRRQTLGAAWAEAFYAEDEREFIDTYQRATTGTPPPPSKSDPVPAPGGPKDAMAVRSERLARYGEGATSKLEALDARQREFDQNIALARAEWSRLQAQANLSAIDRDSQLHQFIATHFDAPDLRRAMGLAKLPAP